MHILYSRVLLFIGLSFIIARVDALEVNSLDPNSIEKRQILDEDHSPLISIATSSDEGLSYGSEGKTEVEDHLSKDLRDLALEPGKESFIRLSPSSIAAYEAEARKQFDSFFSTHSIQDLKTLPNTELEKLLARELTGYYREGVADIMLEMHHQIWEKDEMKAGLLLRLAALTGYGPALKEYADALWYGSTPGIEEDESQCQEFYDRAKLWYTSLEKEMPE